MQESLNSLMATFSTGDVTCIGHAIMYIPWRVGTLIFLHCIPWKWDGREEYLLLLWGHSCQRGELHGEEEPLSESNS